MSPASPSGRLSSTTSIARRTRPFVDDYRNKRSDKNFVAVSSATGSDGSPSVIVAVSRDLTDKITAPALMKELGLRGGGRRVHQGAIGSAADRTTARECPRSRLEDGGGSPRMISRRRLGKAALAALGVVACLEIAAPAPADAQVYLRRNADGILEATDSPESATRLRFSGKGVVIHSRGFRSHTRPRVRPHHGEHISKFGVAADFIRAIMRIESSYDEFAVSSKGAKGLMQLMPATARRFGVTNPFGSRPWSGAPGPLAYLLGLFKGNIELAAAGYNAGENAVLRYGGVPPYRETRNYVQRLRTVLGSSPLVVTAAESRTPTPAAGTNPRLLGFPAAFAAAPACAGRFDLGLRPRAPARAGARHRSAAVVLSLDRRGRCHALRGCSSARRHRLPNHPRSALNQARQKTMPSLSPLSTGLFETHVQPRVFLSEGKAEFAERELAEAYFLKPRDISVLGLLGVLLQTGPPRTRRGISGNSPPTRRRPGRFSSISA